MNRGQALAQAGTEVLEHRGSITLEGAPRRLKRSVSSRTRGLSSVS
jgi:hypothetical protein